VTRAVLAVCLLALLAGCSGAAGDATGDREPYEVAEPVEVDGAGAFPADGTVDLEALAEGHRSAADGTSYTYRTERLVLEADGSVASTFELYVERDPTFQGILSADHQERIYVYAPGHEKVEERWLEDERTLTRTERPDGSVTYIDGGYAGPFGDEPSHVFEALSVVEETTVREVDDGHLIEGRGVEGETTFEDDYTVEVLVREDGLIASYDVEGAVAGLDGELRFVDSGTYTDVGETSPDRPDWTAEALETLDGEDEAGEGEGGVGDGEGGVGDGEGEA